MVQLTGKLTEGEMSWFLLNAPATAKPIFNLLCGMHWRSYDDVWFADRYSGSIIITGSNKGTTGRDDSWNYLTHRVECERVFGDWDHLSIVVEDLTGEGVMLVQAGLDNRVELHIFRKSRIDITIDHCKSVGEIRVDGITSPHKLLKTTRVGILELYLPHAAAFETTFS